MADDKLKSLGLIVRAVRKLAENHGPTPQQILNYIHMQYDIPKEKIKRQLGSILKRCREFGILKRTFGHQPAISDKPACCDCTDCVGDCGFCEKKPKRKRRASSCKSKRSRMCRSSNSKKKKMKKSCGVKRRSRSKSRRSCR